MTRERRLTRVETVVLVAGTGLGLALLLLVEGVSRSVLIVGLATVAAGTVALVAAVSSRRRAIERHARRHQRVLDATSEAILELDEAGRVVMANPATEKLLGHPLDQLVGRRLHDVAHLRDDGGDVVPAEQCPAARAQAAGEQVHEVDLTLRRADGRRIEVLTTVTPLVEEGRRVGFVQVIRDVTAERETERHLRRSRAHARRIVQTSGDAYVEIDADGRIRDWNRQAERVFGWSADEAIGKEVGDLLVPLSLRDDHRDGLARYLRTGRGSVLDRRIEMPALHRDGHQIPVELTVWVSRGEGDDQVFSAFLRDIGERKASERALHDSARQLAEAEAISRAGSWEWDAVADAVRWSPGMYALTGLSTDAFTPTFQGWVDTVHPEDRASALREVGAAMEEGSDREFEYRTRRPDGSVVDVHTTIRADHAVDGTLLRLFGASHDVTERRRLERRKDEFVAVVSHELRTPLTVILGSLELLTGDGHEPAGRDGRLLDLALRNARRLLRLVNDILDAEQLATGRLPLDREPLDVADVAAEAVSVVAPLAERAGVRLEVDVPAVEAHADRDRIAQVLVNLVGNGAKFTDPGGTVAVRGRAVGNDVVLSVRDDGRGLRPEDCERIFGRFEQTAEARRAGGGSGLGLTICRLIVEQHGGRIWAESDGPGTGTTVTLTLPRSVAGTPVAEDAETGVPTVDESSRVNPTR